MMDTLFWIAVGAFLGWNFPQPTYAKWIQGRLVEMWRNFTNKTGA